MQLADQLELDRFQRRDALVAVEDEPGDPEELVAGRGRSPANR